MVMASSWSGDHDAGHADLLQDLDQLDLGLLADLLVQRRHGLVQQQQLGPLDQAARCATRCCCPPESWLACAARSRPSAPGPAPRTRGRGSRPGARLPASGRRPRWPRPSCAGTAHRTGTSCSRAGGGGVLVMSSPSSRIWPEVASSKPASMRSKVDLPLPELPSSANISLRLTDRLTERTATTSPKIFTTSAIRTNSSGSAACCAE